MGNIVKKKIKKVITIRMIKNEYEINWDVRDLGFGEA